MGENLKAGSIFYDISAKMENLVKGMNDADKIVYNKSTLINNRLSKFVARMDDSAMRSKLIELEKLSIKLKRDLDKKIALKVDSEQIRLAKVKVESLNTVVDGLRTGVARSGQSVSGFSGILSGIATKFSAIIGVFYTLKQAWDFTKQAKDAARDFEETHSKFKVVFKEMTVEATKWADEFSQAVGRSKGDVYSWMAQLQDTFVPLGFARDKSTELSESLVKLAVDVASFNNKADADTIQDFTSALVGNHETVRKYGIVITETAMKQRALNLGFDPKNLTELQKVQIRYNMILEGTSDAQGDAIRTADSLANKEKKLKSVFDDLVVVIGNKLNPAFSSLTTFATEFFQSFTENTVERAIRRMRELGVEAEKIAELQRMTEKQRINSENSDLKKIAKGDGNSYESRMRRIDNQYGNIGSDKLRERTANELEFAYDDKNSIERLKSRFESFKGSEGELNEKIAKSGKEDEATANLIRFYQILQSEYKAVIDAREKLLLNEQILAEFDKPKTDKPKTDAPIVDGGNTTVDKDKMTKNEAIGQYYELLKWKAKDYLDYRIKLIDEELRKLKEAGLEEVRLTEIKKERLKELAVDYTANIGMSDTEFGKYVRPKGTKYTKNDFSVPTELEENKAEVIKPDIMDNYTDSLLEQKAIWEEMGEAQSQAMQSLASSWVSQIRLFGNANSMLEQFLETLFQVAAQQLVIKMIGDFSGGGLLGSIGGLFAHDGGTFQNGKKIASFASGGSFIVPSGYPNDSFPMMVESGEKVTVTPTNAVGNDSKLLKEINISIQAMNQNLVRKNMSPTIVNKFDSDSLVEKAFKPSENKLIRQGVKLDEY